MIDVDYWPMQLKKSFLRTNNFSAALTRYIPNDSHTGKYTRYISAIQNVAT